MHSLTAFEFAKTRVQLHESTPTRNPFLVIKNVIEQEGPRSLYKGCSTLVAGTIVKDGIRFISFDTIKAQFKDPETGTLSPLRNLLAGITAGRTRCEVLALETVQDNARLFGDPEIQTADLLYAAGGGRVPLNWQ